MRADVISHCIAIADPLSSDGEREAAFRWWDDEVFDWRDAQGLVTHAERMDRRWEREMIERMTEPVMQKNGCGQVCVTYMAAPPRNPGMRSWG